MGRGVRECAKVLRCVPRSKLPAGSGCGWRSRSPARQRSSVRGPTLVSKEQARAIETHERALAPHGDAIQRAIANRELGGLAFLGADRRPVVLPGKSASDAWAATRLARGERGQRAAPFHR